MHTNNISNAIKLNSFDVVSSKLKKQYCFVAVSLFLVSLPSTGMAQSSLDEAWLDCLRVYIGRHALTSAPPETIAEGALGNCRTEDIAVLEKASRRPTALRFILGPMTRGELEEIRADHELLRDDLRRQVISKVLDARLEQSSVQSEN